MIVDPVGAQGIPIDWKPGKCRKDFVTATPWNVEKYTEKMTCCECFSVKQKCIMEKTTPYDSGFWLWEQPRDTYPFSKEEIEGCIKQAANKAIMIADQYCTKKCERQGAVPCTVDRKGQRENQAVLPKVYCYILHCEDLKWIRGPATFEPGVGSRKGPIIAYELYYTHQLVCEVEVTVKCNTHDLTQALAGSGSPGIYPPIGAAAAQASKAVVFGVTQILNRLLW